MTWYPIDHKPFQYINVATGLPYSGAVMKAYAAESSTVISMATNYLGASTATSFALNAAGYPVSAGNVIIPHVQQNFKIALYPDQTSADANSGAIWAYDDVQIAATSNMSFYQAFSGDGSTTAFTLSQNLGTDENTVILAVNGMNAIKNGNLANSTGMTLGAGWAIAGNVATATGAISTDLSWGTSLFPHDFVQGQGYEVTFTATRSAGSVTATVGGTAGTSRSSAATFTETIIAGATNTFKFATSGFTGTVAVVSVRPLTGKQILSPSEFTLSGTTLTIPNAVLTGTNNIEVWAPSLLVGAIGALADAAGISETNAAASAVLASQWATLTSGQVATTDYSSKAWAIGGTGVTTTSGKGAAKEWATTTGGKVDTSDYSSKEYAIGTTTRGLSGGGSSKDWASYTGGTVDDTNYSAKYQANISTTGATTSTAQAVIATAAAAAAIAAAGALANEWLFASSTTMSDPGTGNFRMNNATPASVTNLALSALSGDSGNPNLLTFLMTWDDSNNTPRGVIRIEKDPTHFIMLGVNGTITNNTTWVQIPVTVIASVGTFSAADVTFINFVQYGNNGTVTETGSPATGNLAKFSGGSSITNGDLTGDATTSGGMALTLATVNGNVGSFKNGNLTVNAKGLVTAAAHGSQAFVVAVSDETTALTTGTAKVSFRMPYAFTVTDVRGTLTTAATGATLFQFNVKEAGTTIFSTTPTFDASEFTTTTAATPAVISDASLADDALITIDIVAVGNTIAGAGLKVAIIGHPT